MTDAQRELEKIHEALTWANKHFFHEGEMNAALHCSDRVLFSPLATKVAYALESVQRLKEILPSDD